MVYRAACSTFFALQILFNCVSTLYAQHSGVKSDVYSDAIPAITKSVDVQYLVNSGIPEVQSAIPESTNSSDRFMIRILPLSVDQESIAGFLAEIVDEDILVDSMGKLVNGGGIVRENLTKLQAEQVADQLRILGAQVEVVLMSGGDIVVEYDSSPENNLRQAIIDYAHTFMGVPYSWGGSTPSGFDCSGYIVYVFREFGVDLPRVSRHQQRDSTPIKFEDLKPGDLVFFSGATQVNHVGIVTHYDGKVLKMIHASSSIGISVVDVYSSSYWQPRLHSAGTYLELYDFFQENPHIAEGVRRENPEALQQVVEFVRETQRSRKKKVRMALGIAAGSTGIGGELATELLTGVHIRFGYSQMNSISTISSGLLNIYGQNSFSTSSLSLIANIHLSRNLYLAAGGFYYEGENQFTFDENPDNRLRLLTIDPAVVEGLTITHEIPRNVYPYIGLGYGRAFSRNRSVTASAEFGLMYQTNLQSSLSATGGITPAELQEQEALLRDGMSDYNLLPVVNFKISFRLF